jgi:hypothetical protein
MVETIREENMRPVALVALVALAALRTFGPLPSDGQTLTPRSVTVPMVLDHNRMLVDAEFQREDGTWRPVRLWVDTGNPDLFMSDPLARDLGKSLPALRSNTEVTPPARARIGGMLLDFRDVRSKVIVEPAWLFSTMHNDANLPSTVLKRYHVVFDYPRRQLTLAERGSLQPRGRRLAATINARTGIVQVDAIIGTDSISLALDNGASYSFVSADLVDRWSRWHPEWPHATGAIGCANIWDWWPQEESWTVIRAPAIDLGPVRLTGVGVVGLPSFFGNGVSLGEWYSRKTSRPVAGFLGPNALAAFRVEIDYAGNSVFLDKAVAEDSCDMCLVGITLRPEADGSFRIIGIATSNGMALVNGVQPGDRLLQVGELQTTGESMGTVVDALRGKPGEVRSLLIEREGHRLRVNTTVERFL